MLLDFIDSFSLLANCTGSLITLCSSSCALWGSVLHCFTLLGTKQIIQNSRIDTNSFSQPVARNMGVKMLDCWKLYFHAWAINSGEQCWEWHIPKQYCNYITFPSNATCCCAKLINYTTVTILLLLAEQRSFSWIERGKTQQSVHVQGEVKWRRRLQLYFYCIKGQNYITVKSKLHPQFGVSELDI